MALLINIVNPIVKVFTFIGFLLLYIKTAQIWKEIPEEERKKIMERARFSGLMQYIETQSNSEIVDYRVNPSARADTFDSIEQMAKEALQELKFE